MIRRADTMTAPMKIPITPFRNSALARSGSKWVLRE